MEGGVVIVKEFCKAPPFDWHFCNCHFVDDHNNLQHSSPSWKDTWVTQRLECPAFLFLIAIAEMNVYVANLYDLGHAEKPKLTNNQNGVPTGMESFISKAVVQMKGQ